MKKILTLLFVLIAYLSYGQQINTTNTSFSNGLGATKFINIPSGTTEPTTGLLNGSLFYNTTLGLRYWDGAAWVTLGTSSGSVPITRTLTINGTTYDLSANRAWSVGTITALTGDVTASGTGSVAATLATVNSNVGSFGSSTSIPTFTVNGKGLVTAASGNVVIAPAGTLTGTTLASNVVNSQLNTLGATITLGSGGVYGNYQSNVNSIFSGTSRFQVTDHTGTISLLEVLDISGNTTVKGTLTNTGLTSGSAGNFVVSNSGVLVTRTPAQTLSDIGGASSTATFTLGSTSIALGSTTTTVAGLVSVTSTGFTGTLTGNATTATTATNLAGGSGGTIPYQSAAGTTAMLANGTAGYILQSNGGTSAPTWVNPAVGTGYIDNQNGSTLAAQAAKFWITDTIKTSGKILGATFNNLTITNNGTNTLNIAAGKTLVNSNNLTLTATDGSTLAIGTGGTLGSNAYTSTAYLPLAGGTMVGNIIATDNLYDLGASGATRFRTGYFGTSVVSPSFAGGTLAGSTVTMTGLISTTATDGFQNSTAADAEVAYRLTKTVTNATDWYQYIPAGQTYWGLYNGGNQFTLTTVGVGTFTGTVAGTNLTSGGHAILDLPLTGGTLSGNLAVSKANAYVLANRTDNTTETGFQWTTGGVAKWYNYLIAADGTDKLSWSYGGEKMSLTTGGVVTATTFVGALTGNATTATALAAGRTISITGDLAYTSPSFDGSGNVTAAGTLASVISAGGPTGSATVAPIITYDAKGRLTTVSSATITPAVSSITGLGTGVATALAVNVGSAGAFVTFNGAGGTPSSLTGTNISGTAAALSIGGTATNATNTAITDDNSTNATMYPTWVTSNTGNLPQKVSSTGITWNPSTQTLDVIRLQTEGGITAVGSTPNIYLGKSAGTTPYVPSLYTYSANGTYYWSYNINDVAGLLQWNDDNATRMTLSRTTGVLTATTFSGAGTSLTGTAASLTAGVATILANTRTIWGQNFNGSANVSGALSGATTISATGNISTTVSGMTNPISIGQLSGSTTYGVLSFGSDDTNTNRIGIAGGGGSDKNMYIDVPSTGVFHFRGAATDIATVGTTAAVFTSPVRLPGYTVAGLPTGTLGDNAYVSDALAPAFGAIIVGGGTVKQKVFFNGTNWIAD